VPSQFGRSASEHVPQGGKAARAFSEPRAGTAVQLHHGLAGLVCGGVFEKFPKLRVAFFECSAEWISLLDAPHGRRFRVLKHGFSDLKSQPSDLISATLVTCEADEGNMDRVFAEFPDSHVLMASDYPHYDSISHT